MDVSKLPLNGTKTHPLTAHALGCLAEIARHDVPVYQVNPGVANRLMREDLVEIVWVDAVRSHTRVLRITAAGRERLAQEPR